MPRPPKSFHGFVGQVPIINSISRLVDGCKQSGKSFPHTLLIGPSGFGKTHIANVVAKAMGTRLHTILCGRETSRASISESLQSAKHGDVVFLDEVHGLKHTVLELLYPAMDERKTLSVKQNKNGADVTGEWIAIKPITVIAATDRAGELRNAFRRRCPLIYAMQEYTLPELREIALRRAEHLGIRISPHAATVIAKICRGTPRNLRHMLEAIQLYFPQHTQREITKTNLDQYLRGEGIDSATGLTPRDRGYLSALGNTTRPMSLQSLALVMGADEDYIAHELEPSLIRLGFIAIEKAGRVLTQEGRTYINIVDGQRRAAK